MCLLTFGRRIRRRCLSRLRPMRISRTGTDKRSPQLNDSWPLEVNLLWSEDLTSIEIGHIILACSDIGAAEVSSAIDTDENQAPPPKIILKKKKFVGKYAISADEFTPDLVEISTQLGWCFLCLRIRLIPSLLYQTQWFELFGRCFLKKSFIYTYRIVQ